jgi:predicted O-methyltransferase YrrM
MTIEELRDQLTEKLNRGLVTPGVLLGRMRMLDESARQTAAYTDPRYVPFYHHLGVLVRPKAVLEIGFRLGLFSACVVRGAGSAERVFGFQQRTDSYYSDRLGRANVRDHFKGLLDVYVGRVTDAAFVERLSPGGWDLVIVNEEESYDAHMAYLDTVWPHVADEGLVVMDYVVRHGPAAQAYRDFCRAKNRRGVEVATRYGVGIIQK